MPGVPRLRSTIRFRITAFAVVAVASVLVVAAVALVTVQQRQLIANLDDTLHQRATDLESLVLADDEIPTVLPGAGIAQLVGDGEAIFARTASLDSRAFIPRATTAGAAAGDTRTIVADVLGPGEYRVVSRRIQTSAGPATLSVAAALGEVSESTRVLTTSLVVAIPVAVFVLAVIVWVLVGRTLAPVERIRSEVSAIGAAQLDRRVRVPEGNDEISRLAGTMNEMLDRLETSAERQRRFVADASHELRSPLTRMRSELEVRGSSGDTGDGPAILDSILEEVLGLQQLVDDLLELARADAGDSADGFAPVDLDDIVLREARTLLGSPRVRTDLSRVSAAHVRGNAAQLARAVRNLFDNAARHAASSVTVSLSEEAGDAVLIVSNDGPEITAEVRERIFERFERIDPSRNQAAGGTGLGLAITRDIVERHGGTVAVDGTHRPGARFVLRIPAI
jgi:signal transduction histidine kinase